MSLRPILLYYLKISDSNYLISSENKAKLDEETFILYNVCL